MSHRVLSSLGLCAVLAAGVTTLSFVRTQEKPQQALPVSAIELEGRGTYMPWHTHMVLQSDRRAEWSSTIDPREGDFIGEVDTHEWERLVKFLELVQFDQFKPSYGSPGDDIPEMVVTVHRGAESQRVISYLGEGPVRLWAVRMVMYGIADTMEWSPVAKRAGK